MSEYKDDFEEYLCKKATLNYIPINAILELTPLCNMNCDMCFIRLNPSDLNRSSLRKTEEWISLVKELQQAGTLFVLLTGGEPLLYPGFRDLYLALKKCGMIITVNTNGTLIDEEWADFFAQHPPRRINITLYGKDEQTYQTLCHYSKGFQATLKAIQLLVDRKVDVKINSSITPTNQNDIDALLNIVEELKVVWKFDTYMYPASRERNTTFNPSARLSPEIAANIRIKLLQRQMKPNAFFEFAQHFSNKVLSTSVGKLTPTPIPCRAGRSSFTISWQGEMRPCVMVSSPSVSVFDVGFQTAWQTIVKETQKIRLSAVCNTCSLREVCQTCAACALSETGSYDGVPDYMCRYTKESLRLLRDYLQEHPQEV